MQNNRDPKHGPCVRSSWIECGWCRETKNVNSGQCYAHNSLSQIAVAPEKRATVGMLEQPMRGEGSAGQPREGQPKKRGSFVETMRNKATHLFSITCSFLHSGWQGSTTQGQSLLHGRIERQIKTLESEI